MSLRKLTSAALLGLVALAVLAASAGAAGPGTYQMAKFKVEIKGVQTMDTQHYHSAENECDVADFSFATEKFIFHSKPIVITAFHSPGEFNPNLLANAAPQGIPTTARVTRHYTPRLGLPTNPKCGENDGTGESEELKPDCGTKTVTKWPLELLYDEDEKNAIILGSGNGEDPFKNCPGAGGTLSFPYLMHAERGEKEASARVTQDELFDPSIGKWIALGKGSTKYVGDDLTTKDKLEWDVAFTRIGGKR